MSDDLDLNLDVDLEDAEALGQRRCEVLAALCLAVTSSVVLRGYLVAGAFDRAMGKTGQSSSAWELIESAAGASSLYGGRVEGVTAVATLVFAYLLVVEIGPGSWMGRLGTRVLQGVIAAGALLTLGGAVATSAVVRHQGQIEAFATGSPTGSTDDTTLAVLDRGGTALPVVAGAAVAAYVGWLSWRALEELRGEPVDAAADAAADDGDDHLVATDDPYGAGPP